MKVNRSLASGDEHAYAEAVQEHRWSLLIRWALLFLCMVTLVVIVVVTVVQFKQLKEREKAQQDGVVIRKRRPSLNPFRKDGA